MKIADVEASNVVPSLMTSQLYENIPEKVQENLQKAAYLRTFPERRTVDSKSFLKV